MEQGLKSYFLGDAIYLREIPLMHFMNSGPRCSFSQLAVHMQETLRGNEVIYLTRTFQRMKVYFVLTLSWTLFIVRCPWSLLFYQLRMIPPVSNPRNRRTILVTFAPAIPIQSIAPSSKVTNEVKEHFESSPTEVCRQKPKSTINQIINGWDKLPLAFVSSVKKGSWATSRRCREYHGYPRYWS